MTKIAIVGATGPTGIHLVAELRKYTVVVRAIARDLDKTGYFLTRQLKSALPTFSMPTRPCARSMAVISSTIASAYPVTRCICIR